MDFEQHAYEHNVRVAEKIFGISAVEQVPDYLFDPTADAEVLRHVRRKWNRTGFLGSQLRYGHCMVSD